MAKLTKVIRPQGSTLIEAREYVIAKGWDKPPVISDDWWLDIAGAAESMDYRRWEFPLPSWDDDARARGHRIGQTALQETWRYDADDLPITQVTPPEQVHDFITSSTGLLDTCLQYPIWAIDYAPQLAMPGFGGPLEEEIERLYQAALTAPADKLGRRSPEGLALRAPDFWNMDPGLVACHYVQGELMGPSTTFYDTIDIAIWLLSGASLWLPDPARAFLTRGMIEWATWPWNRHSRYHDEVDFEPIEVTGALATRLYSARSAETVRITRKIRTDMEHRLGFTARLLRLPESGSDLADLFLEAGFIDGFFEREAKPKSNRKTTRRSTE